MALTRFGGLTGPGITGGLVDITLGLTHQGLRPTIIDPPSIPASLVGFLALQDPAGSKPLRTRHRYIEQPFEGIPMLVRTIRGLELE